MVPGALATVMPFLAARPERGRTWASKPTGSAIEMPVGTIRRSRGASSMSWSMAASRSAPAADPVGQPHRDLILGQGRPFLDALGRDQVHRVALAAEGAGRGRDVVGD